MSRVRGRTAEDCARHYLEAQGLLYITSNFLRKTGEIDLIMLDRNTLVFVEVRQRSNPRFASAAASINIKKQQRLLKTAALYRQQHAWAKNKACRFDVIAYDGDSALSRHPMWIRAAFSL